MKKNIMDDMSTDELKKIVSKLKNMGHKRSKRFNLFAVIGVLAVLGGIAFAVYKFVLNNEDDDSFFYDDEDDDEFCDENGCLYTDEKDFE